MEAKRILQIVKSVFPSVTNTNNASICCGVWPAQHGITGNSFFNTETGEDEYMETSKLVLSPTLFERASKQGITSALLSSKKKTIALLSKGSKLQLTAEEPPKEWVDRLGPTPAIYSADINYWLFKVGIDLLKRQPNYRCVYIHTTDYPMHSWAPEDERSKKHMQTLDALLSELQSAAPDAAILLTADHGMNHKTRCWDLEKALANKGTAIKIAISAERGKYVKHHKGYGGTSYVYLNNRADAQKVISNCNQLEGMEEVLTREEAVQRFNTMSSRIGDLVVLGDKTTVFGNLDTEKEQLEENYRTHGSLHEAEIPLIIYNAKNNPKAEYFNYNMDLTRWY